MADLAVLDLADSGHSVDLRWIDDRRDPGLTVEQTVRHAPGSWNRWVREGRAAIPQIRRRVIASRVKSAADQLPAPGSTEADLLQRLYRFFDNRKHAFELLAARISAQVIGGASAVYRQGWLTRAGGDGGVDFVGRVDLGLPGSSTPLVVLGQAKCVTPSTSISPDQVARVVARLRRGWVGAYVTTGTFSRQAQIEIIDDQYPLVLISGGMLADQVLRMAAADYDANVEALLDAVASEYEQSPITHRRPEEILIG